MVTREEVLSLIDQLNSLPGPDGIHLRVIKKLKADIVDVLTKMYNLSLCLVSVIDDWTLASVTPIFKKGSWGDPACFICVPAIKDKITQHWKTQALRIPNMASPKTNPIYLNFIIYLCVSLLYYFFYK